tara:strand:- start:480 stop:785 length:306 start_codon:yes stop_codon:yes gene_type:complete
VTNKEKRYLIDRFVRAQMRQDELENHPSFKLHPDKGQLDYMMTCEKAGIYARIGLEFNIWADMKKELAFRKNTYRLLSGSDRRSILVHCEFDKENNPPKGG